MVLLPSNKNYKMWTSCVPLDGDLLFFSERHSSLLNKFSVPVKSSKDVRAEGLENWSLNQRSWYGYALNKAVYCAWFPFEALNNLNAELLLKLAASQVEMKIPTLLPARVVPNRLRDKLPKFGNHFWIQFKSFSDLSQTNKTAAMQAWFVQNELGISSSIAFKELSGSVRKILKDRGCKKLLNTFAEVSGPNCFAAVIGSIASRDQVKKSRQWLHPEPFFTELSKESYNKVKDQSPQPEDVLVFFEGNQAIHTAFYLGEGLYFEKPGQDFYEPYRVAGLSNWKKEWPGAKLELWRPS